MVLYLRSVSKELGYEQFTPTLFYEDNMGALFMATADQPTKQTRYMGTKLSVLQDWIYQQHSISLESIQTQYNFGDHFTKALGQIKFYEQTNVIMGKRVPTYSPLNITKNCKY